MKKIIVLMLCVLLVFSFSACGSDTGADESSDTVSEETEDTDADYEDEEYEEEEDVSEPSYDASWPLQHREMLRNPDDFEGKTIKVEGVIKSDSKFSSDARALIIENEDDPQEFATILYEGELNEKPLEGDHVSATGKWYMLYDSKCPMIDSDSVIVTPVN